MEYTQQYNELIEDFNLMSLDEENLEKALFEISKAIQKQFLVDVEEILGKEKFEALEKSVKMGEAFYGTTLKHLLPNYEDIFLKAREKVKKSWNQE